MSGYGVLADHPFDRRLVNAELLRTRFWPTTLIEGVPTKNDAEALRHLQEVAAAAKNLPPGLLASLHIRRRAAALALAAARPDWQIVAVVLRPRWRVVVGHGGESPQESNLTFSPTYGVPTWPGSGLKGVTAAHARAFTTSTGLIDDLFGTPRPDSSAPAHRGAVTVLDALPVTAPDVVVDVLTPHVKPYYDAAITGSTPIPAPAEYHNPVPVRFLAVAGTPFRTLLIGPQPAVLQFAELLGDAADDLGLGAKTAAGYGYCTARIESEQDGTR